VSYVSGFYSYRPVLFLATVIYIVDLVSGGSYVSYVLAFYAIEFVPLPTILGRGQHMVAIPAIEDIAARASVHHVVGDGAVVAEATVQEEAPYVQKSILSKLSRYETTVERRTYRTLHEL
jgi:hypothetical protein